MEKLPVWAKKVRGEPMPKYEVDPDKCYPAFFKELRDRYGNHAHDPKSVVGKQYAMNLALLNVKDKDIDQYWIEVAYQCMKMELQRILGRFNFEIRVRAHRGRKDRWALKNHPDRYLRIVEGEILDSGTLRATEGREAREHYRRLRGFVPS